MECSCLVFRVTRVIAVSTCCLAFVAGNARAEIIVPGTGQKVDAVGDDFETPDWEYLHYQPKSSRNIDENERGPLGRSRNGRWLEGPHRGSPDLLRIVPTPRGGIPGSESALQFATLHSGIPGSPTGEPQQDDLMVQVKTRLRRAIPVEWEPSCTVRVYVPPFEKWEDRTGVSFGFRTDLFGSKKLQFATEQYWPGIFFAFRSQTDRKFNQDSAYMLIRADDQGRDLKGPEITPGWWTLGMSVDSDGMCHFFARQGVDDLTAADRITSQYCYGYRAKRLEVFFFNVVSQDDDQTWSTPWIIDDPTFYCHAPIALNRNRKLR
jgi:hypothetical protein